MESQGRMRTEEYGRFDREMVVGRWVFTCSWLGYKLWWLEAVTLGPKFKIVLAIICVNDSMLEWEKIN